MEADAESKGAADLVKKVLSGTNATTHLIQGVLGLSGVLALVQTGWNSAPWMVGVAIFSTFVGATWFAVGVYLRRRRPRAATVENDVRTVSTYLRGLLPFEKGDRLLGRDQDKGQLLAMLRSLEFRFGFLSGEAGAGKTSLLRALILPQLETDKRSPLYVPRAGGDPELAIKKALLGSPLLPADIGKTLPLIELLAAVPHVGAPGSMVIIIDQFEEFFISNRTKEARAGFEDLLGAIAKAEMNVGFLFALRKEFVDDLLDMGTTIPALQSARWRLPLRNMSSATAREMLRKIVQDEHLRFSDQLQDLLVIDLSRDQKVRPVEFQLVLTSLQAQEVFDVESYAATQGAQGVIARFVTEIISPPDVKVSEAEMWTARQVFRALCSDDFSSRRPVGLTREELYERINADAQSQGQIPVSKPELATSLDTILRRGLENFVVLLEDGDRYNLAHDYLASPVRDATAGAETAEERANRVLERYIENARIDRVVVPWKTLHFIRRYAAQEMLARSESKALILRSRTQHILIGAGVASALFAIPALFLPFGVRYRVVEKAELAGEIYVSGDGTTLVATSDKSLAIYDLASATFKPRLLSMGVEIQNAAVSPSGDRVLLQGKDLSIHQVRTRGVPTPKKLLDSAGSFSEYSREKLFGFSKNGKWTYLVTASGRVFAWPENNDPQEIMRVQYLADGFARRIDVSAANKVVVEKANIEGPKVPETGISDQGRMWILDGDSKLFIVDATGKLENLPKALLSIKPGGISFHDYVSSSPAGTALAVSDASDQVRLVNLDSQFQSPPVTEILIKSDKDHRAQAAFSPKGQWLVLRRTFENFYVVNLRSPKQVANFPAIELHRSGSDKRGSVRFDRTEAYVMGMAQDKKFYLWKLDSPPGASAKPVVDSGRSDDSNATFCPDGNYAIVASENGSLHSFDFKTASAKARQIGWLAAGSPEFYHLKDRATVLMHDGSRLGVTQCGDDVRTIHEERSEITNVVDDTHGNLIVIGRKQASRIGKAFFLFGLPVWSLPIPGLDRTAVTVRD